MGVQNFLKGGLLRESVRYKIYIAMITIGNSTDASHAKKLRRIVRDRISIPSNASTNISDSGIRASPLSLVRLHSISIRTAPFQRRGGGEGEFTKLEKEERAMLFLLLDPSLSSHLLDPRYSRRFL